MEFLILAVALMAVGVAIVVVRNRRPTGFDSGIADFEEKRRALAPEDDTEEHPAPRDRRLG